MNVSASKLEGLSHLLVYGSHAHHRGSITPARFSKYPAALALPSSRQGAGILGSMGPMESLAARILNRRVGTIPAFGASLATAATQRRDFQEAEAEWRKVLALTPRSPQALKQPIDGLLSGAQVRGG
jgi:hypothetical protein